MQVHRASGSSPILWCIQSNSHRYCLQALLEAARGADDSLAEAAVARLQKACLAPENHRELTCLAAGGVLSEYFSELSGNFLYREQQPPYYKTLHMHCIHPPVLSTMEKLEWHGMLRPSDFSLQCCTRTHAMHSTVSV